MEITTRHRQTFGDKFGSETLYDVICGGFTAGCIILAWDRESSAEQAYVRFLDHETICNDVSEAVEFCKGRV